MKALSKNIIRVFSRFSGPIKSLLALLMGLFIIFSLLRLYEFASVLLKHSLVSRWGMYYLLGVGYDFLFVLGFGLFIIIPFLFLSLWKSSIARVLFAFIAGSLLVIHLGLVEYYIDTNVPLGADLYGYSWKEIALTVSSSGGLHILMLIPLVVLLAIAAVIMKAANRVRLPQNVVVPGLGLLFFNFVLGSYIHPAPGQFDSEAGFDLAVNKSSYFFNKTWKYFSGSEQDQSPFTSHQYPLYRAFPYCDVLGKFFTQQSGDPNLVFIIIEGLGRDFAGEGARYGGFTPFIDSLMQRSLYWENFLSTSGRTFNVLPSEFGSLPYGMHGFMELGGRMPFHRSLISIVKQRGYFTSFFYGGNAHFDFQDVFLDRQGIDDILDEHQFGPAYSRAASNEQGYSWGYDDGDLFTRSMEVRDAQQKSPRLDIYLTLTSHEPFIPPHRQMYEKRFDERLASLPIPDEKRNQYRAYREVFETLLYVDDALRKFMKDYELRSDFQRTIFFITGDHRLIPVPIEEQIDRFHVPFIIASPLIREPRKFSSISTHADVTPTVLAFLHNRYDVPVPANASWLSSGIDTAQEFRNIHVMPLMRNKSELIDYIDGASYIAGEQTFILKPGLVAEQTEDARLQRTLQKKLAQFKLLNNYICENNCLYPDSLPDAPHKPRRSRDDSIFTSLHIDHLNPDQLFERARSAAFDHRTEEARVICRMLLKTNPRNTDVRMLLGRTFAWEKENTIARSQYDEVLRQAPGNLDAIAALTDLELWSGNNERALALSDSVLGSHPEDEALLVRKASALTNLGRTSEAKKTLRKALNLNPGNEEAAALKTRLGL